MAKINFEISIKDLPTLKKLIDLVGDMLKDERLDFAVREEYAEKLEQLVQE